jgi:hypothetical protein
MKLNIIGSNLSRVYSGFHGNGWELFLKEFESVGFEVFFNSHALNFDLYIYFDVSIFSEQFLKNIKTSTGTKVLLLLEPESVLPNNFNMKKNKYFDLILAGSPIWAKDLGVESFFYPLVTDIPSNIKKLEEREIEVGMIQSNKFSVVKGELYSLRRKFIRAAEKNALSFSLAGVGWNEGFFNDLKGSLGHLSSGKIPIKKITNPFSNLGVNYKSYIGPQDNKIDWLVNVKKNIVIENSLGYISEKLFDSLRSGCATFYVGPKLSNFGIPDDIVINCEPDVRSIISSIKKTTNSVLVSKQIAALKFMKEDTESKWKPEVATLEIAKRIIRSIS